MRVRMMRKFGWIGLVGAMSLLAFGCADGDPGDSVAINRGALGAPPSDPGAQAVGQRHIVVFRDEARGAAALHASGGHVVLALPEHKAVAAHLPPQAVEALRRNPNVASVEVDAIRKPLAQTVPYGINLVGTNLITDAEPANGPVTVCVIDSGYSKGHEDLLQNSNVTFTTDLASGTGASDEDTCGHGSHVAGTIAAVSNGVGVVGVNSSGNVKLKIVQVFSGTDCAWAYSSTLVKALDTCRSGVTGPLVINMSLGGPTRNNTEESAFNTAYNAGVLSIAASGNDGNTALSYPAAYASVVSVGAVDGNKAWASFSQYNSAVELAAPGVAVLSTVPFVTTASVTTSAASIDGHPIEFAAQAAGRTGALVNGGLCGTAGAWSGKVVLCERGTNSFYDKVHNAQLGGAVAAIVYNNTAGDLFGTLGAGNTSTIPAIGITQTDGQYLVASALGQSATVVNQVVMPASGYEAWDGTSMATPHVAGVAARIWNLVPNATNAQVRKALTDTAEDLGTAGRDNYYGFGLVRAKSALDRLKTLAGGTTCVPAIEVCGDNVDNDCDLQVDEGCAVSCGAFGSACTRASDCCSLKCAGKTGRKTCK